MQRALTWFDPRWRQVEVWAFIVNRVSALGLTLYLFLHLAVLSTLARGPEAYDRFIALAKMPLLVAGELLVVIAALYHGLNGLRVILTSFGIGIARQRQIWFGIVTIVALGAVAFAVRMF
jgi:succinate dehydrogenase / fumarate reductase cytochrome b subunit